MKRYLHAGIQEFDSVRESGRCYVDKTDIIHRLVSCPDGASFFLSRPRRFGKTLLCSTLAALFEGRRELFAGDGERVALKIDS
ncbi:MAG: AAA family ATPase, partial [Polyangiaceae bacterium]|nr:AAA family ATPase [Polyangiaceae bacterium]